MAKEFNTIDDFDVEEKTVLVRIDINAPVDPSSGIILDDTRLKLHAQTVKELSNKGAKVVLLASGIVKAENPKEALLDLVSKL